MSPPGDPGQRYIVYTDGAARGNPGPGGAGAVVQHPSGERVAEVREYLGCVTNNVAEYRALLLGLERARQLGARCVEVRSDSELLVKQMRGEWKIKNDALRTLARRAHVLAAEFERVSYVHVRREFNKAADRLANQAIDVGDDI